MRPAADEDFAAASKAPWCSVQIQCVSAGSASGAWKCKDPRSREGLKGTNCDGRHTGDQRSKQCIRLAMPKPMPARAAKPAFPDRSANSRVAAKNASPSTSAVREPRLSATSSLKMKSLLSMTCSSRSLAQRGRPPWGEQDGRRSQGFLRGGWKPCVQCADGWRMDQPKRQRFAVFSRASWLSVQVRGPSQVYRSNRRLLTMFRTTARACAAACGRGCQSCHRPIVEHRP